MWESLSRSPGRRNREPSGSCTDFGTIAFDLLSSRAGSGAAASFQHVVAERSRVRRRRCVGGRQRARGRRRRRGRSPTRPPRSRHRGRQGAVDRAPARRRRIPHRPSSCRHSRRSRRRPDWRTRSGVERARRQGVEGERKDTDILTGEEIPPRCAAVGALEHGAGSVRSSVKDTRCVRVDHEGVDHPALRELARCPRVDTSLGAGRRGDEDRNAERGETSSVENGTSPLHRHGPSHVGARHRKRLPRSLPWSRRSYDEYLRSLPLTRSHPARCSRPGRSVPR